MAHFFCYACLLGTRSAFGIPTCFSIRLGLYWYLDGTFNWTEFLSSIFIDSVSSSEQHEISFHLIPYDLGFRGYQSNILILTDLETAIRKDIGQTQHVCSIYVLIRYHYRHEVDRAQTLHKTFEKHLFPD